MQQINVIVTPKAKQTISVTVNGVAMSVVNSNGSYSTTHYSGTPFIIPDTIIKNTAGATILTQPSATSTGVIADSVITNSDNTFSLNVPAETNPVLADIIHIDSDLTPVVLPAMTPMVCTPPPPVIQTYAFARVMKTGQTTSYRTGDDGDVEAGRETSFLVLKENNPFGNTNRFTDELGGQTYTNNIAIDWSTYDGVSVLGYVKNFTSITKVIWNEAIDYCNAYSSGSYNSGWRLVNIKELYNAMWYGQTAPFNYAPFNISGSGYIASSTTLVTYPTFVFAVDLGLSTTVYNDKTSILYFVLPVRTFSVSGTTLT